MNMAPSGLITGIVGQPKEGKSLLSVRKALRLKMIYSLRDGRECPVWSNMKTLKCRKRGHPWYGKQWGIHIEIDDLLWDLDLPPEKARIRNGILLFDELHHLMSPEFLRGIGGTILKNSTTQFGKRGLGFIFNTHMPRMIHQEVWGLTGQRIHVSTPNHGKTLFLDIRNQKAWNEAQQEGKPYPMDVAKVLHNADRYRAWYDAEEPMSPTALAGSVLSTARWKQIGKGFQKKYGEIQEVVSESISPAEAYTEPIARPRGGHRVLPGRGVR